MNYTILFVLEQGFFRPIIQDKLGGTVSFVSYNCFAPPDTVIDVIAHDSQGVAYHCTYGGFLERWTVSVFKNKLKVLR